MTGQWKIQLNLQLDSDIPLYQQIENSITSAILNGRLIAGALLPGTRQLAAEYRINRNTIKKAFENLVAKGLIVVDGNKGTYVADTLPEIARTREVDVNGKSAFTFNKLDYTSFATVPTDGYWDIRVDDGFPDPQMAPLMELVMTYRRVFSKAIKRQKVEYDVPEAYLPLQQRFNLVLNQQRGFNLKADNVCFAYGQHMVLYMIARILIQTGDTVILPELSNPSAHHIFADAGAEVELIKSDREGLQVKTIEAICNIKQVKAVYVMTQCQYPTTATLSEKRRAQLIELANKYHFAIIETDYDHEYWYNEQKHLPLAAEYQGDDHIIYVSSLSKMLPPFYLLGIVAAPPDFIYSLKALRGMIAQQGDIVLEHTAEELLHEGALSRYTRKATSFYRDKRDAVALMLDNYLYGKVTYQLPAGGLAFWLEFVFPTDVDHLLQQLLRKSIYIRNPRDYTADGKQVNGLRLGFGVLELSQIETVIKAIAVVLK